MKQPIITRDIERKAIYTDIVYDPEWLYIEVQVGDEYGGTSYSFSTYRCSYDFVVDWGDGNIEKNVTKHKYNAPGTYTIRIKGEMFCDARAYMHSIFDDYSTKALSYGTGFNTDIPLFLDFKSPLEIDPSFFSYRDDLTDISCMFAGCSQLATIPDGLFDPLVNLERARSLFVYCIKLNDIQGKMFSKCTHLKDVSSMFYKCWMSKIPGDIFEGCDEIDTAENTFASSKITKIPVGLFSNKRHLDSVKGCFQECENLTSIPEGLFDDCINLRDVDMAFYKTGQFGFLRAENVPDTLFSCCPNIKDEIVGFCTLIGDKDKEQRILSNIGSFYKKDTPSN